MAYRKILQNIKVFEGFRKARHPSKPVFFQRFCLTRPAAHDRIIQNVQVFQGFRKARHPSKTHEFSMILLDEDLEFYSLNNILDHQLGAARPLLTVIELE